MICVCLRGADKEQCAYHVGSNKEGVICEVALSHRGTSDRTGW